MDPDPMPLARTTVPLARSTRLASSSNIVDLPKPAGAFSTSRQLDPSSARETASSMARLASPRPTMRDKASSATSAMAGRCSGVVAGPPQIRLGGGGGRQDRALAREGGANPANRGGGARPHPPPDQGPNATPP